MADTRLDNLIRKLNLKSMPLDHMPGSSLPGIDSLMVHATFAMGQGKLSKEAYLLGRAIYVQDRAHNLAIRTLGAEHVATLFRLNRWSATKPYAAHLKKLTVELDFTPAQVDQARDKLAVAMPLLLAQLAIAELTYNGNCMSCNGTGRTREYRRCRPCGGDGKRAMNERYKSDFILIDSGGGQAYKQWHRTWRKRYQLILAMFTGWENEFLQHLVRHYG